MLERFRAAFSAALTPAARGLLRLGVTPDMVTITGTVLAVLVALVCFPQGLLWQGAVLLGLILVSDSVDGAMARLSGSSSAWGAFLDASLDRIADGAVFIGVALWFAWGDPSRIGLTATLVALLVGQVTSYLKARAQAEGLRADGGLIARADRLVVLLIGALLAGLDVPFALHAAVLVLAVTGTWTVLQRFLTARRSTIRDARG